jgi:hypothetical protein
VARKRVSVLGVIIYRVSRSVQTVASVVRGSAGTTLTFVDTVLLPTAICLA